MAVKDEMDAIANEPKVNFAGINAEIVAEAVAVLDILKAAVVELDKHGDFVDWAEPQ